MPGIAAGLVPDVFAPDVVAPVGARRLLYQSLTKLNQSFSPGHETRLRTVGFALEFDGSSARTRTEDQ
jgi:hypothetical protein